MGIQNWSDDIVLVDLPQEPEMGDELKTVIATVRDRGDCDVVIDFANVDIGKVNDHITIAPVANRRNHGLQLVSHLRFLGQIYQYNIIRPILNTHYRSP